MSVNLEFLCAPDQSRELMPNVAPRGRSYLNVVDDGDDGYSQSRHAFELEPILKYKRIFQVSVYPIENLIFAFLLVFISITSP